MFVSVLPARGSSARLNRPVQLPPLPSGGVLREAQPGSRLSPEAANGGETDVGVVEDLAALLVRDELPAIADRRELGAGFDVGQ